MDDVVVVSAVRTAIGRFGGTLKNTSDMTLGQTVIAAALERAGIKGEMVDETIMASGYRTGDLPINSARVVAVKGGIPIEKPQFTISKACAGSFRTVVLARQIIVAGDAEIMVAGGMECMSMAAYLLRGARWGLRLGHAQVQDQLILFDPLSGNTMGQTAENVAKKFGISRQRQDEWALLSQQRAEAAITAGRFKEQIVPLEVKERKATITFDTDEHPRFGATMEALAKLKPAFDPEGGTVTAGNSSGMNDAGAATVVMSAAKAKELGLEPMAKIKAYAYVGVEPSLMGIGPVPATRLALERAGMEIGDLDLIELNEAFASQVVYCVDELGLDADKTNIYGGAIALGHPISASGAVLITKLLYAMRDQDASIGMVTMCIGGGQGMSIIFER
ncbi:MAG: acetyl-CoA C-acetyltransferase [Deltaproteobacteria bacterium]|nr:acetyl-CoA C-acetyltransferase [Deltaproteobacteria bacterium]